MARSKHTEHFADVWARQCAQRERWTGNLAPDVPVAQPAERSTGRAANAAARGLAGSAPLRRADPPLPSKYRNEKTDGYASKREAKRATELRYLEKAGAIRNLSAQVYFLLIPKQDGERACGYVADFCYEEDDRAPMQEAPAWRYVVEDCKGFRTETYRLKRKLMLFVHGIKIRET